MDQVTTNNFYREVIEASYDQPVLVQFWAPWCGPCHGLTATLDQVADQGHFPIKFTGLDVDRHTDTALQYKVMGVPNTKVFVSGNPVDEFSDPLPLNEIRIFLRNSLMLPHILNYSHYQGNVSPIKIQDLEKEVDSSRRKAHYFLTLARYYFFSDLTKSKHYLEKIPDQTDQFEERLFIKDLYVLMDIEYAPDPVIEKLWAARNALKKKNFESTYQFLLQANKIGQHDKSELPRMALVGFHRFLGPFHELNRKYKSQFDQVI